MKIARKYAGKIDLSDPSLFGNFAAEDEDPERLKSYFVEKPEFSSFEDAGTPISIVRARKGMGKSALLARVAHKLKDSESNVTVTSFSGEELVGQRNFQTSSPHELVNEWQQRLCYSVNAAIGREIGIALTDDAIALVETSELAGIKGRNLIGSLLDRIKLKMGSLELDKTLPTDAKNLLERYQSKKRNSTIWIFVDDIDATFRNTAEDRLRVSTFFSACRALARNVRGACIRASVRTDVWGSIRSTDEALDKVEQYIFDLRWSRRETGAILAQRVRSYISKKEMENTHPKRLANIRKGGVIPGYVREMVGMSDVDMQNLIFSERFAWSNFGAHHVVHVFAAGRPRWALQLCKMAAAEASRGGHGHIIKFGFFKQVLERYGQFRIDDVVREHRHQCPQIEDLIHAFGRQRARYSTEGLLAYVENAILSHLQPTIDGRIVQSPVPLAHFLYRINFLLARDATGKAPVFYGFEDKPHLLRAITNLDEGMVWEIAPSFRQALNLTGPGAELAGK